MDVELHFESKDEIYAEMNGILVGMKVLGITINSQMRKLGDNKSDEEYREKLLELAETLYEMRLKLRNLKL